MALFVPSVLGAAPSVEPAARYTELQPGSAGPRSACSGGAVGLAAVLGALAGLGGRSTSRRRSKTRSALRAFTGAFDNSPDEMYIAVFVEVPNDPKPMQVEVRRLDQVKVLKLVLSMETGISEEDQMLYSNGKLMPDEALLREFDVEEGCLITMKSAIPVEAKTAEEVAAEEEVPVRVEKDGEVWVRVFVVVESPAKKKRLVPIDAPESTLGLDLKIEAYEEACRIEKFFGRLVPEDYGLFIPDDEPLGSGTSFLRPLKKSERMNESKTLAEQGIKGGEEMIFASIAYMF